MKEIVNVLFFLCSSQKHSSLPVDRGVHARKQQDHDEGTFRCDAGRRNRRVDPTKDSDDERVRRAAAEMRDDARH